MAKNMKMFLMFGISLNENDERLSKLVLICNAFY